MTVSTDARKIEACRAFGRNIRWISREDAKRNAVRDGSQVWASLVAARTLFLSEGGSIFRTNMAH